MGKSFSQLRDAMPARARRRAGVKARAMVKKMAPSKLRQARGSLKQD